MFSYAVGAPLALSQHKIVLRREAKRRWPFLSARDLSMIGNEQQLTSMVKERSGGQQAKVAAIVHHWLAQHRFLGPLAQSVTSLSARENEGGARQQSGHRLSGTIGIRP
jgi:hypothetical protein